MLISKQPRVGRAPSQLARGGAYTAAGPGYNLSWCVKPKLDKVRSHIRYSAPKPTDRPTVDFDKVGRVGVPLFEEIGVPPDADFYICGPAAFMSGLVDGLASRGFARDCLHTENFGSGQSKTPGIAVVPRRPPHPPGEATEVGPLVSFTRSNLAVHWGSAFHSLLELAEACDVRCAGRATLEFVITARRG